MVGLTVRAVDDLAIRLKHLLFPLGADVAVLSIDVNIAIVRVDVRCTAVGASCPMCGTWSDRVHGSYLRFPADVPSGGKSVVLRLRVRRFACPNASCERRTFVEQVPGLTRRHGQRTERLRSTLSDIGLALAGRAGVRGLAFSGQGSAGQLCGESQFFELGVDFARGSVTDRRVKAFAIVPELDVPDDVSLGFLTSCVAHARYALVLQGAEE